MASYGMTLRPGKYTLNVAVLDPKSGKGSVAAIPVEVPDLSEGELEIMPLVLLQNIQEGGATPDPKDPMSDFVLGTNRLTPSFDNVFAKTGSMSVIGAVYNATKDPATGKASVNWGFSILKDGKPVAKTRTRSSRPTSPARRSARCLSRTSRLANTWCSCACATTSAKKDLHERRAVRGEVGGLRRLLRRGRVLQDFERLVEDGVADGRGLVLVAVRNVHRTVGSMPLPWTAVPWGRRIWRR
jgi:hypothetical protein